MSLSATIKEFCMTLTKKRSKEGSTRVVIHYDVGFGNNLFIRGSGANLSWDKGILLHNIRPDEWVWKLITPLPPANSKSSSMTPCLKWGKTTL